MVGQFATSTDLQINYPDSDGQPMADNTLQFQWIVTIKENLELLFADQPDVFIAGDLLWYPVEGNNKIRRAPDAMVVFGRPKGDRGSYKQWEEDNIAPQVTFEILSPGNTLREMAEKQAFYQRYGVEEYYLYNPDRNDLIGWFLKEGKFEPIANFAEWHSPCLGIRFELTENTLKIFTPDEQPFLTFQELDNLRKEAEAKFQKSEVARQKIESELEQERQRGKRLAQKLQELGIDPHNL